MTATKLNQTIISLVFGPSASASIAERRWRPTELWSAFAAFLLPTDVTSSDERKPPSGGSRYPRLGHGPWLRESSADASTGSARSNRSLGAK
jgi:hypothetical protein